MLAAVWGVWDVTGSISQLGGKDEDQVTYKQQEQALSQ